MQAVDLGSVFFQAVGHFLVCFPHRKKTVGCKTVRVKSARVFANMPHKLTMGNYQEAAWNQHIRTTCSQVVNDNTLRVCKTGRDHYFSLSDFLSFPHLIFQTQCCCHFCTPCWAVLRHSEMLPFLFSIVSQLSEEHCGLVCVFKPHE